MAASPTTLRNPVESSLPSDLMAPECEKAEPEELVLPPSESPVPGKGNEIEGVKEEEEAGRKSRVVDEVTALDGEGQGQHNFHHLKSDVFLDKPTPERLLTTVANTLDVPRAEIQLYDSFTDLGGTEQDAVKLQENCRQTGIALNPDHAMQTHTLADLQTKVISASKISSSPTEAVKTNNEAQLKAPSAETGSPDPFSTGSRTSDDDDRSSPLPQSLSGTSSDSDEAVAEATPKADPRLSMFDPKLLNRYSVYSDDQSPAQSPATSSTSNSGPHSASSSPELFPEAAQDNETLPDHPSVPQHPEAHRRLEFLLLSTSKIDKAVVVIPKAGPFGHKLVTLFTVKPASPSPLNQTSLASPSTDDQSKKYIHLLQTTLREWGHKKYPSPDVWIVLENMSVKENGEVDSRQVQTWLQNVNHATEDRILALQPPKQAEQAKRSVKPKRVRQSPRQRKIEPGHIRLSKVWEEEEKATVAEGNDLTDTSANGSSELYPLSPMQQLYFRTIAPRKSQTPVTTGATSRYNESILVRLRRQTPLGAVAAAVEALVKRHAMLRARFCLTSEGWAQIVVPHSQCSYRFGQHNADTDAEILSLINLAQDSINIINGPVFAVEYIDTKEQGRLLYLAAHRLVADPGSWQIMLHDLDELLVSGSFLSPESISFPQWLDQRCQEASRQPPHLLLPFHIDPPDLDFWHMQDSVNSYGDAESLGFHLNADLTETLLQKCNSILRTESADIILASVLLSFSQTFPERSSPTIWQREQGHDARNADPRTREMVGWFTSLCPLHCNTRSTDDFVQVLKLVKDTQRAVSTSGHGMFAAESVPELTGPTRRIPIEILFDCQTAAPEIHHTREVLEAVAAPNRATNAIASETGIDVDRLALFDISVRVDSSGTNAEVTYNRKSKHGDRIATWVGLFEQSLLDAIERLRVMNPELTLADTPLLKTSYEGMEKLASDRLVKIGIMGVDCIETIYPVTPMQQEMLITREQNPDTFLVHSIFELKLPAGRLADQSKLCQAWEKLVMAHPSLRSIFIDSISETGLYDQVVLKKVSPEMLFLDASDPHKTLAKLPSMPSAPSQPRHRLSVCQSTDRTLVRIDASQTICDSSSVHILMEQLDDAYNGVEPTVHRPLWPTYVSHVQSMDASDALPTWTSLLQDTRPCFFPQLTVEARPQIDVASFNLEVTSEQMQTFCLEHDVQPLLVVQLAWALVLRAFVGMQRVTLGCVVSDRDVAICPGVQQATGSFVLLLPCSVDLSRTNTLVDALTHLKTFHSMAEANHVATVSLINDALDSAGQDLFNTCVSFESFSAPTQRAEGQPKIVPLAAARTSDCNVSLSTAFFDHSLHVDLSYRHMTPTQANNVASTFEKALKEILERPSRPTAKVDLVTDRDLALLTVRDWESGLHHQKVDACLHNMIISHARDRPTEQAICSWDGNITYRQLEELSLHVSGFLVSLGVEAGTTIPVILEKNKWAPVIMLGVLRAGCCFLPLDCQDKMMVETMISQLDPPIILSTNAAWETVSMLSTQLVLINDHFFSNLSTISAATLQVGPHYGACVFFSPGKTRSGQTRSIFFTHSSLASTFTKQGPKLNINPKARVLQLSAFHIDIALVETIGTLFLGGCICIPSVVERMQDLAGAITRMDANWSYMTAVLARRLVPSKVPMLKTICFRTRSLDEDTFGPWLEGREVLLAYGAPDVCPLGVSIASVSLSRETTIIPPPIMGRYWVIDAVDPSKPVPVGAIGELGIDCPFITPHRYVHGGVQVAPDKPTHGAKRRGYLRTGHRVRYLDNGNIQFISSMRDMIVVGDTPVAVSEVEKRIRHTLRWQQVDVCVEAVTTSDNVQVLAAFLEYGERNYVGSSDMDQVHIAMKERAFLAKKATEAALLSPNRGKSIPRHHVPSAFIPIKRFPISSSLKVNKRRLQKMVSSLSYAQLLDLSCVPNPSEVQERSEFEKPLPLTRMEEQMRRIWATILEMPPAGISSSDDFMSIGGSKHTACQLVVRARQAGYPLSILHLLQGSTLTEICQTIAAAEMSPNSSKRGSQASGGADSAAEADVLGPDRSFVTTVIAPQVRATHHDVRDVADASPSQIRSLEVGMCAGSGHASCLVLCFNSPMRYHRLQAACETLTRIHPVLRTAFVVRDRKVYQVLVDSFKPAFERFPCPVDRMDSVLDQIIAQDRDLTFNMTEPVTRFSFIDSGDQGKLVIRLSKAQFDENTLAPLSQDLVGLYTDLRSITGKPTFFDYSRSSALRLSDGLEYWRRLMKGAHMTQVVQHPRPYASVASSEVGTLKASVDLNAMDDYELSFDTIFKAGWAMVLAALAASSDVVFGELVSGKGGITLAEQGQRGDVSSMVGPLSNIVPVRVGFPMNTSTPLDLMTTTRDQRVASREFESIGLLDIIQNCTTWAYWTRFSSVVQFRNLPPVDQTATMNVGSTTFTYNIIESLQLDVADVFVQATMSGSHALDISLSYPTGRVGKQLATHMLSLLTATLTTLTSYDKITQQIVPSGANIEAREAYLPRPSLSETSDLDTQSTFGDLISAERRSILQAKIESVWTSVIDPLSYGVPHAQLHQAAFYDLWGSLLLAGQLAKTLNKEMRDPAMMEKLQIPPATIERIRISPGDVLTAPTMEKQFELLARRLREAGYIPSLLPKGRSSHLGPSRSASAVQLRKRTPWTPTPSANVSTKGTSFGSGMAWTKSLRQKGKDMSKHASVWVKHKSGNTSLDSTHAVPETKQPELSKADNLAATKSSWKRGSWDFMKRNSSSSKTLSTLPETSQDAAQDHGRQLPQPQPVQNHYQGHRKSKSESFRPSSSCAIAELPSSPTTLAKLQTGICNSSSTSDLQSARVSPTPPALNLTSKFHPIRCSSERANPSHALHQSADQTLNRSTRAESIVPPLEGAPSHGELVELPTGVEVAQADQASSTSEALFLPSTPSPPLIPPRDPGRVPVGHATRKVHADANVSETAGAVQLQPEPSADTAVQNTAEMRHLDMSGNRDSDASCVDVPTVPAQHVAITMPLRRPEPLRMVSVTSSSSGGPRSPRRAEGVTSAS